MNFTGRCSRISYSQSLAIPRKPSRNSSDGTQLHSPMWSRCKGRRSLFTFVTAIDTFSLHLLTIYCGLWSGRKVQTALMGTRKRISSTVWMGFVKVVYQGTRTSAYRRDSRSTYRFLRTPLGCLALSTLCGYTSGSNGCLATWPSFRSLRHAR